MDRGAWWGTVPMGFKESDTTEQVTLSLYDYTVEVTNRFKGLDLIECLKNYGWRFVTLYGR